jgi:cytochrome P450 family 130
MAGEDPPLEWEPFGRDTWRDPYQLYRRLREESPVHYAPSRGLWVLSRFADVYAAALDSGSFSSASGISLQNEHEHLALLPTMVMADPPEHTRLRRMVNRSFSPGVVSQLEPALRSFVRERLRQLCEDGQGDLIASLARPVPCFVVAHYLGVPAPDRDQFAVWTEAIVQGSGEGSSYDAVEALKDLYGYFSGLLSERRREPRDDMLSFLLDPSHDGDRLTDEEILGYAFVMVAGGNDTMTGLIGGAAELLTDHWMQREVLLERPEVIRPAVDEFLRLTAPVQGLCRVTTREVSIEGVTIPGDSRVMLCYGSANRDPREFGPDAEDLDVTRKVRRHLTFASGVHHCLGAHAAKLQGRVVIEELLRSCPDFWVDSSAGVFADGAFTRRYESLPFFARAG